MSSKEVRYTSQRISPPRGRGRSRSRSLSNDRTSRSRSRSRDGGDTWNPGNNLYVTGLSTRVADADLEKYFNKEGKVKECQVILDPRSRESRGFAFVTMETKEDADRCIKCLDRTVLEGRLITVERAKRRRARTPTPGKYRGLRDSGSSGRRTRSPSPYRSRERARSRHRHRHSRSRSRSHSRSSSHSRSPCKDSDRRRRDRSASAGSDGNRRLR